MIVWSGYGFLGLLIPIATAVLAVFLSNATFGKAYSALHTWPLAVGTLIGAALVYLLSVKLDRPGRLLIDPATGQRVVVKARHTLFWIPLRWIALIAAVIGVVLLVLPANTMGKGGQYDTAPTQNSRNVVLEPAHLG